MAREIQRLDLGETAPGTVSANWLHIVRNGLGEAIRVPILVARGRHDGPVLGLTAAVHGNELNGIPIIQQVVGELDLEALRGTVVGVLAVNVPGVLRRQRVFDDGVDLNHIAPGKPRGTTSQIYLHRFIELVVGRFDALIDLHTASFGRVNSFYVRADMDDPRTARLARLQGPDIIVHNPPSDTTLRGAAAGMGIAAITAELCDPHVFQNRVVDQGVLGVRNAMADLGMTEGPVSCPLHDTLLCRGSYWMYTDRGGLLRVLPRLRDTVKAGEPVAEVRTIFGERVQTYTAPEDGVVVGRSVDPINQTGSRILHLGRAPRAIPCITVEDEARATETR